MITQLRVVIRLPLVVLSLILITGCLNSSFVQQEVITATVTNLVAESSPMPDSTNTALPPTLTLTSLLLTSTISPSESSATPIPEELLTTTSASSCELVPQPILEPQNPDHPEIYLSGSFFICDYPYRAFDLDKGLIGKFSVLDVPNNLPGADIYLTWGTAPDDTSIQPLGKADARDYPNQTPPSREECSQLFIDHHGFLGFLEKGAISCVLTDEGRMGYFQVVEVNPLGELSVEVNFVIWNSP